VRRRFHGHHLVVLREIRRARRARTALWRLFVRGRNLLLRRAGNDLPILAAFDALALAPGLGHPKTCNVGIAFLDVMAASTLRLLAPKPKKAALTAEGMVCRHYLIIGHRGSRSLTLRAKASLILSKVSYPRASLVSGARMLGMAALARLLMRMVPRTSASHCHGIRDGCHPNVGSYRRIVGR